MTMTMAAGDNDNNGQKHVGCMHLISNLLACYVAVLDGASDGFGDGRAAVVVSLGEHTKASTLSDFF